VVISRGKPNKLASGCLVSRPTHDSTFFISSMSEDCATEVINLNLVPNANELTAINTQQPYICTKAPSTSTISHQQWVPCQWYWDNNNNNNNHE
jgi:hypothetical protein